MPVHPIPSDEEEQPSPFIEAAETAEAVGPPAVVHKPVETDESPAVESDEPAALRRSARERKMPEYLKDYVISTL